MNLASLWYSHWGYLKLSGTTPVLIGEFGGHSVGSDAEGVWQRSLVTYLQLNGFDYTYWCWNPNSGDTGGVLEDDWTTLNPAKIAVLQAYQWPLLGSPEPAAAAQAIVAAYQPPTLASAPGAARTVPVQPPVPAAQTAPSLAIPSAPSATFAIGGPFDPDPRHALSGERETILRLAQLSELTLDGERAAVGAHAVLADGSEVFLALEGEIDVQRECRRLAGELARLDRQLSGLEAKLANPDFTARAPGEVVAKEREKEKAWRDQRRVLADKLRSLGCS